MEVGALAIVRHYFPGNNTSRGFFSYYGYILSQKEANRMICIKGGPGTGKSTFLKKIGEAMEQKGENIDYLHCSADENSLDGILLPDKKIAFIDGTSPHVIDPVTPGAVDYIINFGEFWNEKKIAEDKEDILKFNGECSKWYKLAYHYLHAAKSISDNLSMVHQSGLEQSELYKLAAELIEREYKQYPISIKGGTIKKFFATGITPNGLISYVNSLIRPLKNIYLINVPEGYRNQSFMQILMEGAVYRGFDVEVFYCPMDPEFSIEHIIVPALSLAFITTNKWHDLEPWEVSGEEGELKEITLIDIADFQSIYFEEQNRGILTQSSKLYAELIDEAVRGLSRAKEYHDMVERMYIRNMDFSKVDELIKNTINSLS